MHGALSATWHFSWISINTKLLLSYIWALKLYADLKTKIQLYLNILCVILYFIITHESLFFLLLGSRKDVQISLFFPHGRKLNFFFFHFSKKLKVTQITRDWTIDIRNDPWGWRSQLHVGFPLSMFLRIYWKEKLLHRNSCHLATLVTRFQIFWRHFICSFGK